MAWPYDARLETAVAGQRAQPLTRNEMQDRIVDLHKLQFWTTDQAISSHTAGMIDWIPGNPVNIWFHTCSVAPSLLKIPILIRSGGVNGGIIHRVKVKVHNVGAATMVASLYTNDLKFDTSAGAPVAPVLYATGNAAAAGAYETLTMTPAAPFQVTDEMQAWVEIAAASPGDVFFGLRLRFEPLTATP